MNRRTFLKSTFAAGLLAALSRNASSEIAETDQKLILSAPLTHSDWMLKPGIEWGPAGVKHMLDACKACGWSKIYWRALDGGRSLYKSALLDPGGKWDIDSFWSPQNEADKQLATRITAGLTPERRKEILKKFDDMDYANFDALAEAVHYGHEIGLEIHAWVTINEDDHGWGLRSRFSKEHPQFRWKKRDGRLYHSQMSFAFDEVRKYKLALLEELIGNYPVDGIFLDWIRTGDVRDNPQTVQGIADSGYEDPLIEQYKKLSGKDPHDVPNSDDQWLRVRAEPQTLFMRSARELIRNKRKTMPLAVMVGHPWHYRGEGDKMDGNLKGLLLDVKTWAKEGLMDSAVAAGYYRDGGTSQLAHDSLKSETNDNVDIWTYAWVPTTSSDFQRDTDIAHKSGAKQILLWEADYIDDHPNAPELKRLMSASAKR